MCFDVVSSAQGVQSLALLESTIGTMFLRR